MGLCSHWEEDQFLIFLISVSGLMSETELILECWSEISISKHLYFSEKWNAKLAKKKSKIILIEEVLKV